MEILQIKSEPLKPDSIAFAQPHEKSSIPSKHQTSIKNNNNNNEIINNFPLRDDTVNTSTTKQSINIFYPNTYKKLNNDSSSRVSPKMPSSSQQLSSSTINTGIFRFTPDSILTPLDSTNMNNTMITTAKYYNDPNKSLLDASIDNIRSNLLSIKRSNIGTRDGNNMANTSTNFKFINSDNVSNINLIASNTRWSSVERYNIPFKKYNC